MFRVCVPAAKHFATALLVFGLLAGAGCSSPEERAQGHYERGMEFLKKQDYAHAAVEFKNALQLKKDMLPALLGLAQVKEHEQKWSELGKILYQLADLDKKNVDARVRLARIMLLDRNYEQALKVANEAEQLEDKNATIRALKAIILFKLGETGTAITQAQMALDLDPLNAEALLVLAAHRFKRGDSEGALLLLDRDPEKHANDLGIQLFKLKILDSIGDIDKTEAQLKNLIETYPQENAFRKQLAQFYLQHQRKDDAEKIIRGIAEANPTSSNARLDLMRFIYEVRGPDTARQELVTLINAGENVFPYQMALADLDYAQGRARDSVVFLEKLSKSADSDEHKRDAKIKLAEQQIGQRDYDAADKVVADILAKDRRNVSGLKLRASIRLAQERGEQAIADLREAINEQPDSADLLRLLAVAYERTGSIELADEAFGKAVKAAGSNPGMGLQYAVFLQRRGQADRAEDLLGEMMSRSPNNPQVLAMLAQVRLARKDYVGAQQIAESLRRASGSKGVGDQILGEALAGQNQYDLSVNLLHDAYAASPNAVQPMAALVRTYLRAKQPDRAEAFLNTVLQANPASAEAYILLGSVQVQKGEPDKALASFNAAIEKQPDQPAGYLALSQYYTEQRKYAEAIKVLQAGVQKQPANFALRLAMAGIEGLQGNHEAAIAGYEALLKEQPDSLVIMNNLASLLSDYRNDQASLDRAHSLALSLTKTEVPQFKDTLGWVQYRQGDYKSAIRLLQEAQQALPDLALVRYHLGRSYLAAGELSKATEQLKKALELLPTSGGVAEEDVKAALKQAGAT